MRPFSIFSIISILLTEVMTGCERQSIIRIDDDNSPVIIAHRGYWNREGGKQNDLESYKAAIEAGFAGAETEDSQTLSLAKEIIERMNRRETLFIPQWDEVFKDVVGRYQRDPRHFGLESYEYKLRSGRIQKEDY